MADRMTALEAQKAGKMPLPPGYELEHEADVLLLRRGNGSVAATFSAKSVTPAQVTKTAEEDHRRNRRRTA
jgi:hypothetical protein